MVIPNEYYNNDFNMKTVDKRMGVISSTRNMYGRSYTDGKSTDNLPLKQKSSRSLNHYQRRGVLNVLLLLFALIMVGYILSGLPTDFNTSVFDSFQSYRSTNYQLPRIQTILDNLANIEPVISIRDFVSLEIVVGNWGVFDFLRDFINIVSKPFVFVGSFITNMFSFVITILNTFIP